MNSQLFYENIDRVIALILVLGCLILICLKIDSEVKSVLTLAAGWAFGSTYQRRKAIQAPTPKTYTLR